MPECPTLDVRIKKLRRAADTIGKADVVDSFSWESFLTQYNQLDVDIRDELEEFQVVENE